MDSKQKPKEKYSHEMAEPLWYFIKQIAKITDERLTLKTPQKEKKNFLETKKSYSADIAKQLWKGLKQLVKTVNQKSISKGSDEGS